MIIRYKLLFLALVIFCSSPITAQELNCAVQISSQQIQGVDPSVFEDMRRLIREFLNDRKWTGDKFAFDEKIECSVLIDLSKVNGDQFEGSIHVQARRPVFGTSYNSTLFNHKEDNFRFTFRQFENLEFSETSHISNLTSVLAFYVYIILALDYDSFSLKGGAPYYQKALTIINNAQSSQDQAWKAHSGDNNRYWLVENALDRRFEGLRACMYKYHRKGLDIMAEKPEDGRKNITEALEELRAVHRNNPNSFNMQVFFNAKADEVVNIYSEGFPDEKTQIVTLLSEINPGNNQKYQKIISGK